MHSDVMSLVVALYAIKVRFLFFPQYERSSHALLLQLTNGSSSDSRYSYGWHRAEILAALVNGVFLLALCFSISLEAIGRFFTTPGAKVINPYGVLSSFCFSQTYPIPN